MILLKTTKRVFLGFCEKGTWNFKKRMKNGYPEYMTIKTPRSCCS